MKKIARLALAALLIASLFTACSGGAEKVIKVGIFEPASGGNGPGGKQETLGIRYANSVKSTANIGGKEYKIEVVEVDNQSDTSKAITAAQELVNNGVSIVVGSYGSGVSIAAADVFAGAKLPAIGASCTNPQVTEGNPYYFRVCFLDPFQGTVMANFAWQKGCKTATVLTEAGDDYSVGLGNYFAAAFKKLGGNVSEVQFQTGETDFSAIMAQVAASNAEVLFSPSSIESAPLIIKQARAAGITCPIMAGDTWENETIISNAGNAATEVYLSTFFDENDTSTNLAKVFVTGFKTWLKEDSTRLTNNGGSDGVAAVSALGYDAYMVAVAALESAGSTDGEAVKKALAGINTTGVTGSVSFDNNGDAKKDMAYIKTIENGKFKFLNTVSVK